MAESAKGWHNIQLGVMGFIGLCGVLTMGETPDGPQWLEWWSAGMAGLAFVFSLLSTWMVGSVAFPLYGFTNPGEAMPASAPGRLRGGIVMTFISIAPDGAVQRLRLVAVRGRRRGQGRAQGRPRRRRLRHDDGRRPGRLIWLQTSDRVLKIEIGAVAEMSPVSSC